MCRQCFRENAAKIGFTKVSKRANDTSAASMKCLVANLTSPIQNR